MIPIPSIAQQPHSFVPSSAESTVPCESTVAETSVSGPIPFPNNVTILPGESGPGAKLTAFVIPPALRTGAAEHASTNSAVCVPNRFAS